MLKRYKNFTVSIYITADNKKKVDEIVKKTNKSCSSIIGDAIKNYYGLFKIQEKGGE